MTPKKWNWNRWPFALLGFALSALPAVAHEKWFVDEHTYHGVIPDVFRQPSLFGVTVVILAFVGFMLALAFDRSIDGSKIARQLDAWFESKRLNPKTALAVTLGASLMGAGLQHTLFTPGLALPATTLGAVLAFAQTVVGVSFLFLTPYYAELGVALILLWLGGLASGLSLENMGEELLMVGAGLYFITAELERQPWARWNNEEIRRRGYQAFRILTGLNFLVLASVKWLRPDLAISLVTSHHINFMSVVGMTDGQFIFCAAVAETVIALCILLRCAFRPAVLIAFNLFLLTIYVFGFKELLGHLPIKATLFLFLVNGHWHKGERKLLG